MPSEHESGYALYHCPNTMCDGMHQIRADRLGREENICRACGLAVTIGKRRSEELQTRAYLWLSWLIAALALVTRFAGFLLAAGTHIATLLVAYEMGGALLALLCFFTPFISQICFMLIGHNTAGTWFTPYHRLIYLTVGVYFVNFGLALLAGHLASLAEKRIR